MPRLATLEDLLVHQLRDAYSAERQLVQAMPKLAKNASARALQSAIKEHLAQTEVQVERLEQVFELLGVSSRGPKCKAMEGLIDEAKDFLEEDADPAVLDAGIIAAAQRVEHYEIAVYGTCIAYAARLGHTEVVSLLEASLSEERDTDESLTELAENGINAMAEEGRTGDIEGSDNEPSSNGSLKRARAQSAAKTAKTTTSSGSARRTTVGSTR